MLIDIELRTLKRISTMRDWKIVVIIKHTQTHLPTLLWGLLLFFVSINASPGQDESPSKRTPRPQAISTPDSNQESKPPLHEMANISIAESRQRLDDLEQPLQQLAEQVRAAEAKLGKDHADSAKLRAELRARVQQTFAARQEIQRAELTEFTRRLQRMQQSIETRERIAEKIVERRVEELLNPDTQWPPKSRANDGRIVATTSDGTEISYIPWKAPKNAPKLSIDLTAWGEPVNGLRVALAVTDGPETKPGTQRLHLVINNVSKESIQLDNTGWADDFTMAMHVRRNSGEQVETRRPEKGGRFFAPFTDSYSLEPGETVVLATKLIGLADDSNSDNSADLLIADKRPQTNAEGHRTWYLVGTSLNVPAILGHGAEFCLHTDSTSLKFRKTADAKQTRGLPEQFHGDWKVEQIIVKGGDVDLSTILNPYLKITADHFVIPFDGNIRETRAYTLAPGTPTKVDLILEPSGSKARALGIVEVTDDTFKLCFREPADVNEPALTESDRPRTFGPASKMHMVQCRRTKDSDMSIKATIQSKPVLKELNGLVFDVAATDQTSPPESAAEKAIARMVLVFFQDEARRAVPGLMLDRGTETFVLTTGPATIVPDGVGHAIDRTFLEFPGNADVDGEFFNTKTADILFYRAKPGLTKFQMNEPVDLAIGDSLSAII